MALDRPVAIKILPGSAIFDGRTRERFLREARIIAHLHHDHIVPIHAVGEEDGVLYYVMDVVVGTSLDQIDVAALPQSGSSRAQWVAGLGLQAAETLAYAHRRGVVHRDVKPSNFLLDPEGRLWLADFGVARLAGEASLTCPGEWVGTLRYLAPESLEGQATEQGDVYGLGLTMYELLVGAPAFAEDDRMCLLRAVLDGSLVPPRRIDPSIPRGLEGIVLKATTRDPERRYPTADTLAEDLRSFLAGDKVRTHGSACAASVGCAIRRHPLGLGASALAAVLAVALAVVVWQRQARVLPAVAATPDAPIVPGRSEVDESAATGRRDGPPWGPAEGRGRAGGVGMGRGWRGFRGGSAAP
jgi:serine/threonine protein kinase